MSQKVIRKISLFLFPLESATSLGLFRFFFYGIVFFIFADQNHLLNWQEVPLDLWFGRGLTEVLKSLFWQFNHNLVFRVWQISLILSAFGLFTRISTVLAFGSGFLLIGYAQSFGYFTRLFMPILWVLFFMIFAKSGDAFSIDQRLNSKKRNSFSLSDSDEYGWPIQFAKIIFCVVFFQAGLSKLINGGVEWLDGISLQNRMLFSYVWPFNSSGRLNFQFHHFFFDNLWVSTIGAFSTVIFEFFCPLALFSRRLKAPIILGLAIMQALARFTIFVNFSAYIALYIAWLPWGKIAKKMKEQA